MGKRDRRKEKVSTKKKAICAPIVGGSITVMIAATVGSGKLKICRHDLLQRGEQW